jgi:hypothetical protein
MGEAGEQIPAADRSRARLYAAAAMAGILAVAIVIVVVAGSGGGGSDAQAADPACISEWNGEAAATGFGVHLYNGHNYSRVQVLRMDEAATPTDSAEGNCTVIFAAEALDPEPGARGWTNLGKSWTGLESLKGVTEDRIAKLQADAVVDANATLASDGTIATLSSDQ